MPMWEGEVSTEPKCLQLKKSTTMYRLLDDIALERTNSTSASD